MGMNEKQEYMKPQITVLSSDCTQAGKVSAQVEDMVDGGSAKGMGAS